MSLDCSMKSDHNKPGSEASQPCSRPHAYWVWSYILMLIPLAILNICSQYISTHKNPFPIQLQFNDSCPAWKPMKWHIIYTCMVSVTGMFHNSTFYAMECLAIRYNAMQGKGELWIINDSVVADAMRCHYCQHGCDTQINMSVEAATE